MPTLGGAAMFVGFLVAIAVASQIDQFSEMFSGTSEPAGLMLGAAVMFAVGALDDLREVSPPAKIAGMVLAGSLLSLFGVSMLFFRVPFAGQDTVVLSADLAPLVTVMVVVVFANAINLIDGLDGLAAGIVIIAGSALFLYSDRLFKGGFLDGSNIAPLVAVIAVGICLGFLPYNFNPARIFMGDAGALFLGLLLATTTITIGGRADYQYPGTTYFFYAPLFIPIVILGVPILDTAFSLVRRVVRGKSFAVADKDHLHHRLMRLGHGPRRTVVILWLWTALLSGLALLPTYTSVGNLNALVPIGVFALALVLYAFFVPGRRGRTDPEADDLVDPEDEPGEVVDLESRRREAR
jgi:UDP-GlcNAc:undecaprenyl-phosphate GlcNAc-1-phosphate transferase